MGIFGRIGVVLLCAAVLFCAACGLPAAEASVDVPVAKPAVTTVISGVKNPAGMHRLLLDDHGWRYNETYDV